MRGLGGITDALDSLLATAGIAVEPWFFPLILMVVFAALVPHIRQNQRTQRARIAIREGVENGGAGTDAFQKHIIELANGHATTLLVITTEAQKRGLKGLARKSLRLLEQTGKHRNDARKIRVELEGRPPLHPEAENAAIEELVEQGLFRAAKARLEKAQLNWPNHSDWEFWEEKIKTEE